jgi:large subunit ribosomal protein L23
MNNLRRVIKGLQITEKGTRLTGEANKYLFKVDPAANKLEIKRAVEEFFKVSVKHVNTMNCAGKARRERTMHYGKTSDWKRAIVTLKQGDKIDFE